MEYGISTLDFFPDVVKLVDTSDLGSDAARCGGSSPSIRTFQGLVNWGVGPLKICSGDLTKSATGNNFRT